MKRYPILISVTLAVLLAFSIPNAYGQKKKSKSKDKGKGGTPEWISKPGVYEDVIVAAGIGEGLSEQVAKSEAELSARKKIAEVLQSNIRSLSTNFMEEASTTTDQGSSSAAQEYFSEVTQSLTELTLKGVFIEEYYPPKGEKTGKNKIKFYAKAVLKKGDMEKAFRDQVSSDAAADKIKGVKLNANNALLALDKAIAKWNNAELVDDSGMAGGNKTNQVAGQSTDDVGSGLDNAMGGQTKGSGGGSASYGDWTKGLPNMPRRDGYYQGLGVVPVSAKQGEDAQKVEAEARAQVIRAIRSEITSKVTNVMEESTKGGASEYSESFNSLTESFSSETLKNLKVEFYIDKKSKKHYAYCEISIAEVERQFAERLKKAINVAKTYFQAARQAETAGDYYTALTQYLEGAKEIVVAELINKEPIEGDIDGSGKAVSVKATFDTQLKTLLGRMRVEIVSGEGQKGTKGEPLALPLTAKLVYDKGGSVAGVKNANLSASAVAPTVVKIDETSKTDGSGTANFTLHSVETVNPSGVNKVRIGLNARDFEMFASQLPGAVEKARSVFKDFSFTAKGSAITKIVILIFETNMGKENSVSIVEGDIVKQLVSNKFKVIDKGEVFRAISKEQAKSAAESSNDDVVSNALKAVADVLIIGAVEAKESEGGANTPYGSSSRKTSWAGGSVRCIDLENGKIIANSEKQGIRGQQLSLEKAGIMALTELSKQTSKEILDGLNQALR